MGDGVVLHELAASCGKVRAGAGAGWGVPRLSGWRTSCETCSTRSRRGDTIFAPAMLELEPTQADGVRPAQALPEGAGEPAGVHERAGCADDEQRVGAGVAAEPCFLQGDERLPGGLGAELYGGVRTVVATGRRQGLSALAALCAMGGNCGLIGPRQLRLGLPPHLCPFCQLCVQKRVERGEGIDASYPTQ